MADIAALTGPWNFAPHCFHFNIWHQWFNIKIPIRTSTWGLLVEFNRFCVAANFGPFRFLSGVDPEESIFP